MRALPMLLFFAACVVPVSSDTPGSNGLGVEIEVDGVTGQDTGEAEEWLEQLLIHLDECRFDGVGPDGRITTSDGIDVELELRTGAGLSALPTLSLLEGDYTEAQYSMTLGGAGPAFEIHATLPDGEVELTVPGRVTLTATASEFSLPDGPDPVVTFTIDPQRWFDRIDLDQATLDSDDVAILSPTDNADLYAEVLAQILDDAEGAGSFPEPLDDSGGD